MKFQIQGLINFVRWTSIGIPLRHLEIIEHFGAKVSKVHFPQEILQK